MIRKTIALGLDGDIYEKYEKFYEQKDLLLLKRSKNFTVKELKRES